MTSRCPSSDLGVIRLREAVTTALEVAGLSSVAAGAGWAAGQLWAPGGLMLAGGLLVAASSLLVYRSEPAPTAPVEPPPGVVL